MEITREALWEFIFDLPDLQRRVYFISAVILAVCFRKKSIKSCLKYYFVWFIAGYLTFYLADSIAANMYYGSDTYIMISKSLINAQFITSVSLIADAVFLLFIFQQIYRHPSENTLIFYILSVVVLNIYEYLGILNIAYYIISELLSPLSFIYNLIPDTIIRF